MAGEQLIDHRKRAICLALAQIDRAEAGAYSHVIPRRAMLQGLIDEHGPFEVITKPGTMSEKREELSVDRYEAILKLQCQTFKSTGNKLYANGSKSWGRANLEKYGYTAVTSKVDAEEGQRSKMSKVQRRDLAHPARVASGRSRSPVGDVDDNERASAAADLLSDSDLDDGLGHPAPARGKRKRSDAEIVTNDGPRPLKIPRQETTAPTPSPLSPKRVTQGELNEEATRIVNQKRKRDDDETASGNAEPPLRKSPKIAAQASGTILTSTSGGTAVQAEKPSAQQKRKRSEEEQTCATATQGSKRVRTEVPSPGPSDGQKTNNLPSAISRTGSKAAVPVTENQGASATAAISGPNQASSKENASSAPKTIGNLSAARARRPPTYYPFGDSTSTSSRSIQSIAAPATETARAAAAVDPPRPQGPDLGQLQLLGENMVENTLKLIWYKAQESEAWITKHCSPDMKCDLRVLMEPSPQLERLYVAVLGDRWRGAVREMKQAEIIDAGLLIQMLSAAAIKAYVWDQPLPWPSSRERVEMFAGEESFWNNALHMFGRGLRIETLAWAVTEQMWRSSGFQKKIIEPQAEKMAEIVFDSIKPQLAALGADQVKTKLEPQELWRNITSHLKEAFFNAYKLKALIMSSAEDYTIDFPATGTAIDPVTMNDIHRMTGENDVAWRVAPRIKKKVTPESDELLVAKAIVFTMPRGTLPA